MSDPGLDDADAARDERFAERIAAVLRAPERLDDGFEAALVATLRDDKRLRVTAAPSPARPLSARWWRTPVVVRFSPAAAAARMALAAALIVAATLAPQRARPAGSSLEGTTPLATAAPAVAHDTVTLVRFVFVGRARTVSLVGDFNAWDGNALPLTAAGAPGAWAASVPLSNGRHEYAFIVDGKRWTADPFAPSTTDDFGTHSSIITVGD